MKRKIAFIFISFFIMIGSVRAVGQTDIQTGDSGNTTACSSSYCYHVSVGIRLTPVRVDTGERCKYDATTKTLCGSTGTPVKSVDLWAIKDDSANQYTAKDACIRYAKMHTKYEWLNDKNGAVVKCNDPKYFNPIRDISAIGLSTFSDDQPVNFVSRVQSIVTDMNNNNYNKIDSVLGLLLGNGVKFQDLKFDDDIYENGTIQVEQIIAFGGSKNKKLAFNVYGTVAEVTYLFQTRNMETWCVSNNTGNTGGSIIECSDTMRGSGYITGFYGYGLKNSQGQPINNPGKLSAVSSSPSATDSGFRDFQRQDTVGVSHILLREGLTCDKKAKEVYDSTFSQGKENYEKELLKHKEITMTCGTTNADLKKKCNELLYENVKMYGKSSMKCQSLTCPALVTKAYNKTSNQSKLYDYFKNFMTKLFPQHKLLDPDIIEELGRTKVECSGLPNCDYSADVAGKCGNSISIKDGSYAQAANKQDECWKSGFAYSSQSGGFYASSLDFRIPANLSSDPNTRIEACNIYCSQNVSIELPKSTSTKAGTLLKWTISDTDNQLYGTLKVEKTCIVKAQNGGTCQGLKNFNYLSSSKWVNKVYTDFRMNYKEPTSGGKYDISNREMQLIPQKDASGNPTTTISISKITCNNPSCSNVGQFTTSQKFDIKYKEKYEWYSFKEDNSFVEKKDIDSDKKHFYYEVGYGLPTAFTTPEDVYGEDKAKGLLNVHITKLGYNITPSTDRFKAAIKDKLGVEYVKYSCNFKIINELYQEECEYDEYGNPAPGSPDYCYDKEVKDIDVVFRTVSLLGNSGSDKKKTVGYAFPGRSGSSRKIGRNWWSSLKNSSGEKITSDDERYDRIIDILDSTVYSNKKPQYIIKLDSPTISDIRKQNKAIKKDNQTKNKDPYSNFDSIDSDASTTGYKGYYCYDENGKKHCSSRFLTYLASKKILWGYCMSSSGGQGSYEGTTTRAKNIVKGKYCKQT